MISGWEFAKRTSMVGTGRFELPTPRTPSECSTRLSHVPTLIEPRRFESGLTKKFYTSLRPLVMEASDHFVMDDSLKPHPVRFTADWGGEVQTNATSASEFVLRTLRIEFS